MKHLENPYTINTPKSLKVLAHIIWLYCSVQTASAVMSEVDNGTDLECCNPSKIISLNTVLKVLLLIYYMWYYYVKLLLLPTSNYENRLKE